ncbi:hypothetical protein FNV62_31530 [Streptomyces sp. RLB3-17]|nr:hypothetical protein FNV58_33795 [Streptomyces sp. RLB1-9]QDO22012.1 hypothetical protein FNV65_32365 [Streptomyces sp. S1A1-8]QDO32138.1 hypothetical protein FNV63_32390 [Streptomyces sp. S1A1-3]QDO42053.1 hypothetical protein FNV62_31530 [Streptomyces sp. RLB3-17]
MGTRGTVPRPRRPYPSHPQELRPFDPARGAAPPGPPHRPERPRPQTPDGLGDAGRGGWVDGGGWGSAFGRVLERRSSRGF